MKPQDTINAPLEYMPDPLTPQEVADVLRVGRSTVFELIKRGEIRHLRVGKSQRARILIYKADLEAWIEANKQGTAK
jgi:putative molybdopterin biosynthesis protein